MPRAADGTPMHSFSRAKHHDEMMSEKKSKPAMEKPAKEEDGEKPDKEASQENIHDVVKQHGPAHHVEIEHDEESGKHHVHSKHGDAEHEHHAVHDSAEEAHEHAGHAMGVNSEEEDESPDEEMAEEMAPAMEEGEAHSRIPGMA